MNRLSVILAVSGAASLAAGLALAHMAVRMMFDEAEIRAFRRELDRERGRGEQWDTGKSAW